MAIQILSSKSRKILSRICWIIISIYVLATPFMEVTYTRNEITNYSGGAACYVVMGTAYLFYFIDTVLFITNRKKVDRNVFIVTVVTSINMVICVTTQLLIPTFLFTGCGIAVVTVGMFFTIENPTKYYKQRAFVDISTGVKNKNCYDEDIKTFGKKLDSNDKFKISVAVCDLNNLKYTNDTFGHLEGDEQIRNTALLLTKCFQKVHSVYRFGGDEFVALFVNREDSAIEEDINTINAKCAEISKTRIAPLSIAIGFASTDEIKTTNISDLITLADKRMYEVKKRQKESMPNIVRK